MDQKQRTDDKRPQTQDQDQGQGQGQSSYGQGQSQTGYGQGQTGQNQGQSGYQDKGAPEEQPRKPFEDADQADSKEPKRR